MPFDITDAYENVKNLRKELDFVIVRQEYLMEILTKEGIFNKKDFDKWVEEKYKEEQK